MILAEKACWDMERKLPNFDEDFYLPLYLPLWYSGNVFNKLQCMNNCVTFKYDQKREGESCHHIKE
jgi:hypothetical protein